MAIVVGSVGLLLRQWTRCCGGEGEIDVVRMATASAAPPQDKHIEKTRQPCLLFLIGLERAASRVTTTTHTRRPRKKKRGKVKGIG